MKIQRYSMSSRGAKKWEEGPWVKHADLAPLLAALEKAEGALEDLVARCDGSDGVLIDRSNLDTTQAHAALAAIKEVRGER